jgi:hypothetical protein
LFGGVDGTRESQTETSGGEGQSGALKNRQRRNCEGRGPGQFMTDRVWNWAETSSSGSGEFQAGIIAIPE